MAPSPARQALARRDTLSTGGIIGVSIGMAAVVAIIFILSLPFILRARRHAKARRRDAAAAEVAMAGSAAVVSPTSTRRVSVDQFAPPAPVSRDSGPRPVKEFDADGNSYEDTPVAPQSQVVPALASPVPRHDGSGAPQAGLAGESVRTESPKMMEPLPEAGAGATASTSSTRAVPGRSEESRQRKSSKGSISQAIEELAGKASAVFRRTSTRSERSGALASPTRSPTWDLDETLAPAISAPQLLADDDPHTTGASAEYYSGLPMSPPELDDYPQTASPTVYTAPSALSQGLVSMTAVSTFAGVPMEPRRTDSGNTEFSPLSPVSPPIKLEHSFDEEDESAAAPQPADARATPPVKQEAYDGVHIKSEFSPPPSKKALVPSPPLPAPGTVNPMDIWNPMNADERGHKVVAELHQIENSPPPAPSGSTRESTPAQNFDDSQYLNYHTPYSQESYTPSPGPSGPIGLGGPSLPGGLTVPPPIIMEPTGSEFDDFDDEDFDMTDMTDVTVHSTPPPPSLYSGPSVENTPLTAFGSEYANSASPGSHYAATPNPPPSIPEEARTFECPECKRVFDQIHKLNHHKRYHERPHECPHPNCDRRFGTKTHLDRHINDKHNKTRKYHCTEPGCPWSRQGGKSFPRKDNWRRHMQNKHNFNPEHDPVEEVVDESMTIVGY